MELAAETANRQFPFDPRVHCLGAVGIRRDGAIVRSRNASAQAKFPRAHAESRLVEKLGKDGIVFVCRVRKNGEYGMAKPCTLCQIRLRQAKVQRVYYTTDEPGIYGCWEPGEDYDQFSR